MKIGILTHPLSSNYGGILQCFALNTYLQKMGHETIVIDRKPNKDFFLWRWIRMVLKVLHCPRYYTPNKIDKTVKIRSFVDRNIRRTKPVDTPWKMKKVCRRYGLDAVIVGSDQVWRTDYAMKFGYNYFLDFVPDDVVKASYAASFGLSDWRYNEQQTIKIKSLLSRFKSISVREDEGVSMIRENVGFDSFHLLDPTLLLDHSEYDTIIADRLVLDSYVFVYWLGDKSKIQNTIEKYRDKGCKVVDVNLRDKKAQYSVEEWLSCIKYADTVITDSFHGCAFSVIFNVQFIIFPNDSGGNRRLISLFNQLGLNDKLLNPELEIDYSSVNQTIQTLQKDSLSFFNNILS